MAVSSSQSTGSSRSISDTYIPEYSESPFLRATAEAARARADQVYNWGMDVYLKNQGNIDGLMRDALSYASPQRIAVDMAMAMAGVQQAGERGRLSAIRDLESYGIDPSSGRYAALDSANRVMTSAAAAGAGNQQRMASQAAGNAMRNQAIAAGLQNANFGLGVGDSSNRFLQTAMSLKYPPLGRRSESSSEQQSTSGSSSEGGGGSKQGQQPKEEKPKQEQQPRQPGGGGQPRESGGRGEREGKEPPGNRPPPIKPAEKTGGKTATGKSGAQSFDEEGFIERYPGSDVFDSEQELPQEYPGSDVFDSEQELPNEYPGSDVFDSEQELPNDDPNDPNAGTPVVEDQWGGLTPPLEGSEFDSTDPWGGLTPPDPWAGSEVFDSEQELPAYDPYTGNTLVDRGAFDPVTGESTGGGLDGEQVAEADPAGNLYGWDEGGGWTGTPTLADYSGPEFGGAETWSDIGQGTVAEPTAGEWDSTYDAYTEDPTAVDWGAEIYDRDSDLGVADEGDPIWGGAGENQDWTGDIGGGDDQYGDYGDYDDAYGDLGDYEDPYADYGDEDYYDDWGGEEDYYDDGGDYGDYEYDDPYADWGEEDYYDDAYGDLGDEDYYEDYGDDYNPDDYYEDYGDDYDPGDYYEEDAGDYYDDSYDDSGGDYEDSGGDYEYEDAGDYAAGGPVKPRRQNMRPRPGGRSRRPATGYGQRPPMRRPIPGAMPGAGQLAPPPRPPGGAMRLAPPPQPPRPVRGAPMPARGGPQPAPRTGYGQPMPGNFISANGMPAPTTGGMPRPQRMANGGGVRPRGPNPQHATSGGFVSRELSPSGGSQVDDVQARLNAEEFVIPKDVAMWKGKEFFYKMIAQARKNRSAPNGGTDKAQTGYGGAR